MHTALETEICEWIDSDLPLRGAAVGLGDFAQFLGGDGQEVSTRGWPAVGVGESVGVC